MIKEKDVGIVGIREYILLLYDGLQNKKRRSLILDVPC
jgi:hypothetical protein